MKTHRSTGAAIIAMKALGIISNLHDITFVLH